MYVPVAYRNGAPISRTYMLTIITCPSIHMVCGHIAQQCCPDV